MKRASLGKTGIEVTELCCGTLTLGHLQADFSPEEGARAIRRSLESGVNFIDTAKGYRTYAHTRIGIEGFSDVVIASKSTAATAADMRADVETCLRETGRDIIDIFHLHLIKSSDDLRSREGALDALVRCRKEGMIRAVGLSAHGPEGMLAGFEYGEIEVMLPVLNRKGLGIIGGTIEAMLDAIRDARSRGIGLYDMKPLGGGHLIDDIPGAIAFIRDLGLFDSIAVGMKTPEEAEVMAGVFEGDPDAIAIALAMGKDRAGNKRLIVYDACKRCGECVDACAQEALSLGEKKAEADPEKCILCGYCAAACPNFVIRVV